MEEYEYQHVLQVKRQAESTLLAIPGVHGVGIGYKKVQGEPIPQVAIVVHLTKKRPLHEVAPSEVIPSQIEGIPTDVVEHEPLSRNEGQIESAQAQVDSKKYRPLQIGCQIACWTDDNSWTFYGTVTAFVRLRNDSKGLPYLLTCQHILPHPSVYIYQPYGKGDYIGQSGREVLSETVDAAIVPLIAGLTVNTIDIIDLGPMEGPPYTMTVDDLQYPRNQVKKRGRTTGVTYGTVDNLDYSGKDSKGNTYKGLLHIVSNDPSKPFVLGGDSGSAVLNSAMLIVGMLILGSNSGKYGGATPIAEVFTAFPRMILLGPSSDLNDLPTVEPRPGILSLKDLEAQVAPELEQSATGRMLLAFYRQHGEHLADLVHHDEAVAAVWAANGGPVLLTGLYNAMQDRSSQVLPTMLGEVPVPVALENIALALKTAGGASLADGLEQIRPVVMDALGKSWPETLSSFVEEEADDA